MIISIISFALDLLILNIINYNHGSTLIFPMFTIVSLLSSIYFRKDRLINYFTLSLYMCLTGLVIYPVAFYLIALYIIRKDLKNFNFNDYLKKLTYTLVLFDLLFFLFSKFRYLNYYNTSLLINKIAISIPINIIYSIILFSINKVLKRHKNKYKLV